MENKKSFGEFIRTKRTELGLTQKSFADKLFVTESAVSKWERGISYPDVTLITDICAVLQINEHELLTSSEDVESRNYERIAKRLKQTLNKIKITQFIIYGITLITCFICNIAVQHTLSWFFIVAAALLTSASITLLPVLIVKKRGLITLAGFTLSLILLLLVCCIYTGGDWFTVAAVSVIFGISIIFLPFILNGIWLPEKIAEHKAVIYFGFNSIFLFLLILVCDLYTDGGWFFNVGCPITAFSLIPFWGMMIIMRYTKINRLFKAACCISIGGVFIYVLNNLSNAIISNKSFQFFLPYNFNRWNEEYLNNNITTIITLSLFAVAVLFAAAGAVRQIVSSRRR